MPFAPVFVHRPTGERRRPVLGGEEHLRLNDSHDWSPEGEPSDERGRDEHDAPPPLTDQETP